MLQTNFLGLLDSDVYVYVI